MTIYRTNNPMEYDQIDGVVVDERAPTPNVRGLATGVAILVGRFTKGPKAVLTEVGSLDVVRDTFCDNSSGWSALQRKTFSRLRVIRVNETDPVAATLDVVNGADDVATFTALATGAAGNSITVTIEGGTNNGDKYTITSGATTETYDDQTAAGLETAINGVSALVTVEVTDSTKEPTDIGATNLAGGAAGVEPTDSDYENAIAVAEGEGSGNILFLDSYTPERNALLKTHAGVSRDKMVICAGPEGETVSAAILAVESLRDSDGRIVYAFNHLLETTSIAGDTYGSPAGYLASILSNTSAHIDPSFVQNTQFLYGVSGVHTPLSRSDFIQLNEAGIAAFQNDPDIGVTLRNGVTTQILDSSKVPILRRRMSDWISNSVGAFLKNFQGAVNNEDTRNAAKASILGWIQIQEQIGILPTDDEVRNGRSKIVDVETPNTDATIGEGRFTINYRQRIFSSMRFIVLTAEIGTSVVVTEGA